MQWMELRTPNGEVHHGPDVCGDSAVFLVSDRDQTLMWTHADGRWWYEYLATA